VLALAAAARPAAAVPDPVPPAPSQFEAELRAGASAVEIQQNDQTWWGSRLDVRYRNARKDIFYLAGETETRGSDTNGNVFAGAYLRRGDWFFWGEARGGPGTTFLPEFGAEGQVGRLFHHTLVSVDYRFIDFPATDVHLGSAAVNQSFAWGEIEARVTLGKNVAEDAPIRVGLMRALWFVAPGWRVGGGAAYGTRLFDVIAVETADKQGWTAFAHASRDVGPGALRVDFAYSREGEGFRQVGGALTYRRTF
jgi:hypothetical protein